MNWAIVALVCAAAIFAIRYIGTRDLRRTRAQFEADLAEPVEHVGATEQTAQELLNIHYDHIFRPARLEPWSLAKPEPTPWNELDADPDEPTPLLPHRQPTLDRWETHTQTFGPELVALIRNLGHALESDTTDPEQRHDRMQALLDARYGRTS